MSKPWGRSILPNSPQCMHLLKGFALVCWVPVLPVNKTSPLFRCLGQCPVWMCSAFASAQLKSSLSLFQQSGICKTGIPKNGGLVESGAMLSCEQSSIMRGKDAKQFQLHSNTMYNLIMLIIQSGSSGWNSRVYYKQEDIFWVFFSTNIYEGQAQYVTLH